MLFDKFISVWLIIKIMIDFIQNYNEKAATNNLILTMALWLKCMIV